MREQYRAITHDRSTGTSFADMSATEIVARCQKVIDLLAPLTGVEKQGPDGQWMIPISSLPALKEAIPALLDLDRFLPHVECWNVGYYWGREDRNRSTWFGCQSKAQAERILDGVKDITRDNWTLEFGPVEWNDIVKRNLTAEEAAEIVS